MLDVDVIDGYFTVELDFGSSVFDGNAVWLKIGVRPGYMNDPNIYSILSPRQEVKATPYAIRALSSDSIKPPVSLSDSGTQAVISCLNTGTGIGIYGLSNNKQGVYGESANGEGVFGSSPSSYGVHGSSALSYGVYGTGAKGVYGFHIGSGNYGYLADSTCGAYGMNANGNFGALGSAGVGAFGSSNIGQGVRGESDSGEGVLGSSVSSRGVYGASASNYGVYGTGVKGVYGLNISSGKYGYLGSAQYGVYGKGGVYGESATNSNTYGYLGGTGTGVVAASEYGSVAHLASNGEAVYGFIPNGTGVYGESNTGIGVYGSCPGGYGGYFEGSKNYFSGNVGIGTLNPVYTLDVSGAIEATAYADKDNNAFALDPDAISDLFGINMSGGLVIWPLFSTTLPLEIKSKGSAFIQVERNTNNLGGIVWKETGTAGTQWIFPFFRGWQGDNLIVREDISHIDVMTFEFGTGNVGIGTSTPAGKLDVNGSIYQRGGSLHADYVFKDDYQLESIEEHSEFMWSNKHLPAIPKAKTDEAGQQIVEVGAHRKGIVEELEKAHIYIEQLNKRLSALEQKLSHLQITQ